MRIDLETYIYFLLVIAALGMYFIGKVIAKQLGLFKIKAISKRIKNFRKRLFTISIIIVVMGLIPITINVYSLFYNTDRPPTVPLISLIYSAGVHLQSLFLSYVLWRIYRLSDEEEDTIAHLENRHLDREENKGNK